MLKQDVMNPRFGNGPLRVQSRAHTVLLRMAEDQDRAERIRELKQQHPRLTWAEIARRVGVTERAATAWQRTGSLKPENAEALAELFCVDFDFIWRGQQTTTPDPFEGVAPASEQLVDDVADEFRGRVGDLERRIADRDDQLDRIEQALHAAREERAEIQRLIDTQNANLQRQTSILEQLKDVLDLQVSAARRMDEATAAFRAETERRARQPKTPPRSARSKS